MAKIPVINCPAGPALDAAVAKVLGWTELPAGAPAWETPEGRIRTWEPTSYGMWQPSEDIASAWELVESMGIKHSPSLYQVAKWHCNFLVEQKIPPQGYSVMKPLEASGITAPLAITRAFLLAHGVTEVEVADD
jgi:hypothetical protein